MKLMTRESVGAGLHRSGWPAVMTELRKHASPRGILLDDFADASFWYKPIHRPHNKPWVGIFHHPVSANSPLESDQLVTLRSVEKSKMWAESKRWLRGAIALCDEVADELKVWLKEATGKALPVLSLIHPTLQPIPPWSYPLFTLERRLLQVGYCLRNTQAIYQLPRLPYSADQKVRDWQALRLFGGSEHYSERDKRLELKLPPRTSIFPVQEIMRADDHFYDILLGGSVVLTQFYGTAANNLIVECMMRGTPIATNKLPPVVQYLGEDYPLYYKELRDVPALLESDERIKAAHLHLLKRSAVVPTFDRFAKLVANFCKQVECKLPEIEKRRLARKP